MVEARVRLFCHVRRSLLEALIRIDKVEDSPIVRDRTPRITIDETIKKKDLNGLSEDMVFDITQ